MEGEIVGLFNKNKKKKNSHNDSVDFVLHLNMKLMPIDRGNLFEDPINNILHEYNIGEVTGGGTSLQKNGMPDSCNIDFIIKKDKVDNFINFLKNLNMIAKNSYIVYDDKKEGIGTLEGLNLILDGTGLDKNVYKENDVNKVIADIDELLNEKGQYYSYFVGEKTTNLYFYGNSFKEMEKIITDYTKKSPLCENCVIEKI